MRKIFNVFIVFMMILVSLGVKESVVHTKDPELVQTNQEFRDDHLVLDVSFEGSVEDHSRYQSHGRAVGDLTYVEGVKGRALHINNGEKGSYDTVEAIQYVDFGVPDNLQFDKKNHSYSFWLKSNVGARNGAALISNKNFTSGANKGYTVGLFDTGMRFNYKTDAAGRTDINTYGPKDVMDSGWHHYVISVDRQSDIVIYRDGERVASTKVSQHSTSIDTGLPFVLGASGIYHNGIIDAKIDELKIYKTNLSETDALELYTDGAIFLVAKSAEKTLENYKDVVGMDTSLILTLKEKLAKLELLQTDITALELSAVLSLLSETKSVQEEIETFDPNETDPLVLHLEFNGDAKDSSVYGNDAEIVNIGGGSISFEDGIKGQALHIESPNGSVESNGGGEATEYLKLPKTESLDFKDESFTIALWVKQPQAVVGSANALVSNKNYYSGSNQGFALAMFSNGLTVNVKASSGARKDTKRYSQIFDEDWHFIVSEIDRDSKKMKLFYDNKLLETVDISALSGSMQPDDYSWIIGASGTLSNGLSNTLLDEVRFYKGLISEDMRDELYLEFDVRGEFIKEYDRIKQEVETVINNGDVAQERIDEISAGFAHIDEELDGNFNRSRLLRDLKNMTDRFYAETEPIFTFNVVTDTHIDLGAGEPENYDNYLQDIRWLNPKSKVMMNSGDFTTNAKLSEYKQHYEILEKNQVEGRNFLTALGNHDVRWLCNPKNEESGTNREISTCPEGHVNQNLWRERYLEFNAPYMGDDWNGEDVFHKQWVNGYLFIVINTELDLKDWAYISEKQIQWLDETMQESDPKQPVFIAMHQVLEDTAEYIQGDLIGAQDERLKEVLSKYGNAVIFTGHIHSSADRAKVYAGEWGHLMDMTSYSYVYTKGGDRRNQISYQVEVYKEEIVIKVRDHVAGVWIEEYEQRFSLDDKLPVNPRDNAFDISGELIEVTSGSSLNSHPISNLFDNKSETVWKSEVAESRDNLWINIKLDELTQVSGIRYLPAKDSDGTIREFEVWISKDDGKTYEHHETGSFSTRNRWELFEFNNAVKVTDIKVKVLSNTGEGNQASGSELKLVRTSVFETKELIEKYSAEFEVLNEVYYEESSYQALQSVIETAKVTRTPSQIKEALVAIEEAKEQLKLKELLGFEDSYEMIVGDVVNLEVNFKGVFKNVNEIVSVVEEGDYYTLTAIETGSTVLKFKSEHGIDKEMNVIVKMNTEALDELVLELETLDETLYTSKSYEVLRILLDSVEDFVNTKKQADLPEFIQELENAKEGLVLKSEVSLNFEVLKKLITETKEKDFTLYTEESVERVSLALEEAEKVLACDHSLLTQKDIDNVSEELKESLNALVLKEVEDVIDTSQLELLISIYKEEDFSKYTEESVKQFKDILGKAEALLNKVNARSSISQKEIDDMVHELTIAFENLKTKDINGEEGKATPPIYNKVPTGIQKATTGFLLIALVGITVLVLTKRRKSFHRR